jgi:hypothetical protein
MVDVARGDAALAWLGAMGLGRYLLYIHRQRSRSLLEQRMLMLLYCLAAFCVARGFWGLLPGRWMSTLTVAPATLLPLAATLLVEGMLRRHASLALKITVAAGSVVFFLWNLLPSGRSEAFFLPFTIYALATFAWLALALIRRDRSDIAPMENRFADAASVSLIVAAALALTEFGIRPSWMPYGLGGVGVLIFVFACVHLSDNRMRRMGILIELARFFAEGAAIAAIYALAVHTLDRPMVLLVFLLSSSFVFLFGIRWRLRSLARRRHASLRGWLVDVDARTLDEFIVALRRAPWAVQPLFLREAELTEYEAAVLAQYLSDHRGVASLAQLRTRVRAARGDVGGAEQLIDLLESHDMTYVALLGEEPTTLMLVNLPDVAGVEAAAMEIALIQKIGRLLPNPVATHV